MPSSEYTLEIEQDIVIDADCGKVFSGLIERLTTKSRVPDETPMPMVLEQHPGGRWFRDLGDDAGHLWGFVQVIKPPQLLEIHGPMFMSYPATNHIAFRVEETATGTKLSVKHTAFGLIQDDHREGLRTGWEFMLNDIQSLVTGS